MRKAIVMPPALRRAIVDHATRARPLECCGFVVGDSTGAAFVVPMRNVARSRVRYRIDDRAHIDLRRLLRMARPEMSIVGVYHSHPDGKPWPSATDIDEAFYPDWIHLIVGFTRDRATLRAFQIRRRRVSAVALR